MLMIMMAGLRVHAQMDAHDVLYIKVGKPMPDLLLRNIANFSKKEAKVSEFRGKWLVLDFWSLGCGSCVASFPHYSKQQQRFGDSVQVMMVGDQDKENQTYPLWQKLQNKLSLKMPSAFDSTLHKILAPQGLPFVIVINDKGIVKAVTGGLLDDDLISLMEGQSLKLHKVYQGDEQPEKALYNVNKPFLVNNNGGYDSAFIFRSLIAEWDPEYNKLSDTHLIDHPILVFESGRLETIGNVNMLYNMAYTGKSFTNIDDTTVDHYLDTPILLLNDSSQIFSNKRPKYFAYSFVTKKTSLNRAYLMKRMQHDLSDYFGFRVSVERRTIPCWRLVTTNAHTADRLKTKGSEPKAEGTRGVGLKWINQPFNNLPRVIRNYNYDYGNHFSLIDETGITGNIDLNLGDDVLLKDLADVKKRLQKVGLNLIPGTREVIAIVLTN